MNAVITKLTERLEDGIRDVFSQEHFLEYLKWQTSFYEYSANNQMLIWLQTNGNATCVAGYKSWQKMGRFVKKGEKAIKIIVPIFKSKKKKGNESIANSAYPVAYSEIDSDDDNIGGFIAGNVFDVSQTDGKPMPEICNWQGGDYKDYEKIKDAIIGMSTASFSFLNKLPGDGRFNAEHNRIEILNGLSQEKTLSVMLHELAHSIMHSKDKRDNFSRADREMQAESVAYIACSFLGIENSQSSFEYVASWSTGKDARTLRENMFEISNCGKSIVDGLKKALGIERKENVDE